jgi:hypothetical protein
MLAAAREDIELIRDPEEKRAAYGRLIDDLNRDIATAAQVANKSTRDAKAWAAAWQITGNRKQYAKDAEEQAKKDGERLEQLKQERDEVNRMVGARAEDVAARKAANAAAEKSEQFLSNLEQEVELLKASKEEQRQIEASRNTTDADRGRAEQLMEERDALLAKAEAEKESAAEHKRILDEQARETQRLADAEANRLQKIEDMKKSEIERLQLQRIELEQGKEAAKVQALKNQGIDDATAKQIAAEEARLERLREEKGNKAASPSGNAASDTTLTASESRLLTRGPASRQEELMRQMIRSLDVIASSTNNAAAGIAATNDALSGIEGNTAEKMQMVLIA